MAAPRLTSNFFRFAVIAKTVLWLFLLSTFSANAEEFDLPSQEMNGIDLRKLKGFEEDWRLVTVRYRDDRHEQRLTYANDIAWETLSKGKTNYPDGAIFGKISLIVNDDSQFISSKVPSEKTKIQFMVKDKQKYKETDGWGYALFSPLGFTLKEDHKKQTLACHACHQVVAKRGFVFSQKMPISTLNFSENQPIGEPYFAQSFKIANPHKNLPKSIGALFKKETKRVSLYDGPITKHVFTGTIDEMRPILIHEIKEKKYPAILVSEDKEHFVLVAAEEQISIKPAESACKSDESRLVVVSKNGREEARRDYFLCIRQR